ncbi:MAG TPA: hypothetical protein PKW33_01065 [Anaerolineaceae bacterium]|nr:hypothetical protein [Anaerolineaceae bacterium]HPN50146.1 hypothetical protein [Anaerolineaceae bacterium]
MMRTKFCLMRIQILVGGMLLTGCVFTFFGPVSLTIGVSEISHPADGSHAPVIAWSSGSGLNFDILVQNPINGTRRVGAIEDLTFFRDSDKLAANND